MAKEIDTRDYVAEFLAAGGNVKSYATGLRSDADTIQTFIMGRGRKPANKPTQAPATPNDDKI
jgi:hypothetical protein